MDEYEIPEHLYNDKRWNSLLYLFSKCDKLNTYFTTEYFNLNESTIEVDKLKKKSSKWSRSEQFMLNMALHLWNEQNKVNLSDMDYLDETNNDLAIEAIYRRFYK